MTEQNCANDDLQSLLSLDRTLYRAKEDSKKRIFELISKTAAKASVHLDADEIFNGLIAREKLGTTAIGHGVAIPHTRIVHIQAPIITCIHLQEPINFDAHDNQPVDLFFGLLVPDGEAEQHLKILSRLAMMLHDEQHRRLLRCAGSAQNLYSAILELSQKTTAS